MEEINSSTPKNLNAVHSHNRQAKWIKEGSTFKHVGVYEFKGMRYYRATIGRYQWHCIYETERQAAVAVDRKLLEKGEQSVNVLIRVKK